MKQAKQSRLKKNKCFNLNRNEINFIEIAITNKKFWPFLDYLKFKSLTLNITRNRFEYIILDAFILNSNLYFFTI